MELVLKLGLLCSGSNAATRPSMRQVMQYLDGDVPLPEITHVTSSIDIEASSELVMSLPPSVTKSSDHSMSCTESIFNSGRSHGTTSIGIEVSSELVMSFPSSVTKSSDHSTSCTESTFNSEPQTRPKFFVFPSNLLLTTSNVSQPLYPPSEELVKNIPKELNGHGDLGHSGPDFPEKVDFAPKGKDP
ncbi:hypothetical protein Vadar_027965 [Vaccinium darrowii]|uniref:Uncharacterized protein n=1 Tax=Vaccinium darrowii TaxID=229202 RepID=A0ACB7ZEV3_9ERIC|nr:hypothetical protein Vadar_027965 [Vaccinium darrowii]